MPLVKKSETVKRPEFQGYLEISTNGVVSIGMEVSARYMPDHVFRRLATRFYFHPSIIKYAIEYIGTIEFIGLKEVIVKNHCVNFEEGNVKAWIRAEGMMAHNQISRKFIELERIHVTGQYVAG